MSVYFFFVHPLSTLFSRCSKNSRSRTYIMGVHSDIQLSMRNKWDLRAWTVACKETRHLGIFPTRDFELSKSCSNLTLLAPNKGGLEVSKKVQYVFVAQRAAKLCFVKLYEILLQVWQAVVLQPIELKRCIAPFWKPPTSLYLEPRG